MRHPWRLSIIVVSSGLAALLLIAGALGLARHDVAVAKRAPDPGAGAGDHIFWPALPTQTVPRVLLAPAAPGDQAGSTRTVAFHASTARVPAMNMNLAGAPLAPDAETARQDSMRGTGTAPRALPDSGSRGNDNTFVSIDPVVAPPNTQAAVALVASGFQPGEMVVVSTAGNPAGYLPANDDGVVIGVFNTGGGSGYTWVRVQGLFSGKMAGGSFQISPSAPAVPGLAVAPHSVRPGDHLYMQGVRYSGGTLVDVARDSTVVGAAAVNPDGTTQTVSLVVGAGPDGAAIYNTAEHVNPVGTLAGQSVEERADAGIGGGNNEATALLDRPVLSSTIATTLGLVGEGFTPGETVDLSRSPGPPLSPGIADSNGAVAFLVQTPLGTSVYDLRLTGESSGRHGYGSILADSRAFNVASTIVAPSRSDSNGGVSVLFSRYPPNVQVALKIDGAVIGAVDSGTDGSGSIPQPKPTRPPIVHDYAISETFGVHLSSAPLAMVHSGAVTGVVRDAVSGQPIKALVRIGGDNSAVVMSDPTAGGVYTITYPSGNNSVNVTPSGCYNPINVPVTIPVDGVTTVNIDVQRSANDAGGYTCYENAGRDFVAAPDQVFDNTFNENVATFSLPFPVRFYNTDVTTGTIDSNGFIALGSQLTCTSNCYRDNQNIPSNNPPNGFVAANWDDLAGLTNDPASGVYSGVIGTAPNRVFVVEWRNVRNVSDATNVVNTFEIQIDEQISGNASDIYLVYPTFALGASDGSLGTIGTEDYPGLTGKRVQANTGSSASQETSNFVWVGNSIRIWKSVNPTLTPTPSITRTPTITRSPTETRSPTLTPTTTPEACRSDGNYSQFTTGGVGIDPGTTDTGNHGDNVDTQISLPFPYTFYGQTYTTADVSSNGVLQFTGTVTSQNNGCLSNGSLNDAIVPYWDDLRTDGAGGVGIFTNVHGTAPNRIFVVEWRTCIYAVGGCSAMDTNFEIRLYESEPTVDIIYGQVVQGGYGATVGIQRGTGQQNRQYSCNVPVLNPGLQITYRQLPCNTPTITSTPTITRTPTNTPTLTPIPTLPQGTITPVSICGPVLVHFFTAALNGQNEVPPNGSPALGTGNFSFDSSTGVMSYTITFQGLVAQETAADLAVGAPGSTGPVIETLAVGNPVSGAFTFPPADLVALYAGNVYLNIHSSAFPSGEIRAQLVEQCTITPSPTPIPSRTPVPSATRVRTHTPGPSPTPGPCTINFSDVHATDYFYTPVEYLFCHGIISGYADGTFRPYSNTTRAQFAKMIVLGRGWEVITPPAATYNDVPVGSAFFALVETANAHGLISGYACGGPGETCPGRYFRPNVYITRAQISKLIALGMEWTLVHPQTPTFSDVPSSYPFYEAIETVYAHGVISGYNCGQGCLEYRPAVNATRGQLSKMLWIALTQP